MSQAGVAGARALAGYTENLIDQLTPAEWAADAACRGWRVQDTIGHMAFFFNFIADPNLVFPDNPSGTSERLNDAAVRERAHWSPEQVADYYREQAAAGLATIEALQGPDLADTPLEMLDLGTYRMAGLADAVSFDHLVHLTSDLLAPFGPLDRGGPDVAAAIDPAIDWMMTGLPQMCPQVAPVLDTPIGLRLTGVTARTFRLDRTGDEVTVTETDDLPADVALSDAEDFLRWGTRRTAWRSAVEMTGDPGRLAPVLDAIDVI